MHILILIWTCAGIENRVIKWDQVKDCFTDYRSFMFFILGFVR